MPRPTAFPSCRQTWAYATSVSIVILEQEDMQGQCGLAIDTVKRETMGSPTQAPRCLIPRKFGSSTENGPRIGQAALWQLDGAEPAARRGCWLIRLWLWPCAVSLRCRVCPDIL